MNLFLCPLGSNSKGETYAGELVVKGGKIKDINRKLRSKETKMAVSEGLMMKSKNVIIEKLETRLYC